MENPIKMDDLGGKTHYFRKHLIHQPSHDHPRFFRFFKNPSAKPEAVGVSFTVTRMDGTWDPHELKQNEDHLNCIYDTPAITSWGW